MESNSGEVEKVSGIIDNDEALVGFLDGSLVKSTEFVKHFDNQTNILVGISIAVFVFSISQVESHPRPLFLYVLALFSFFSIVCSLYAIHPPKFMRKKGQEESLLYNKKINSFGKAEDYAEAIHELLKDRNKLIKNYSIEIYNLYKYYYKPKRKLFKLSRILLLLGITISFIIYLREIVLF